MFISTACILSLSKGAGLLFYGDKNSLHRDAPIVLAVALIVILTGDQGEHVIVRVRQRAQGIRLDLHDLSHLVDMAQLPSVDDDLVAVLQGVQFHKGTGVVVPVPNVGCDGGVARPSRVGSAFEIAGLIVQPGHIPAAASQRHAHDGQVQAEDGNLQTEGVRAVEVTVILRSTSK